MSMICAFRNLLAKKPKEEVLAETVEGTRDDEENDEWFYLENVCLVISSGWYYSSSTNN